MTDWSDNPDNNMLLGTTTAENAPEAEPMPEGAADAAEAKATADALAEYEDKDKTIFFTQLRDSLCTIPRTELLAAIDSLYKNLNGDMSTAAHLAMKVWLENQSFYPYKETGIEYKYFAQELKSKKYKEYSVSDLYTPTVVLRRRKIAECDCSTCPYKDKRVHRSFMTRVLEIVTPMQQIVQDLKQFFKRPIVYGTDKLTCVNCNLMNRIQGTAKEPSIIGRGRQRVRILGRKSNEILVNVDWLPGEGVSIKGKFTEFDRLVYNAVCSLFAANTKITKNHNTNITLTATLTTVSIYRFVYNLDDKSGISTKQLTQVEKSLTKLSSQIHVTCDATSIFKKKGIVTTPNARTDNVRYGFKIKAAMLPSVHRDNNGSISEWTFMFPPIFEFAHLINQVYAIDRSLLDFQRAIKMPDGTYCLCSELSEDELSECELNEKKLKELKAPVRLSTDQLMLACFTLRRINQIEHKSEKDSDIISLENFFANEGITSPMKKSRLRTFGKDYLTFLAAEGAIEDFVEVNRGRSLTGLKVIVNEASF